VGTVRTSCRFALVAIGMLLGTATVPVDAAELPSAPQDSLPSAESLAQWVQQLGDPAFSVRSDAAERLMAAGIVAREACRAGLHSGDPEIRAACRRVLAIILDRDHRGRLDAFLADSEGRQTCDLPGWAAFRAIAGDGPEARALFAAMQRYETSTLESLESADWDGIKVRLLEAWQIVSPGSREDESEAPMAALAALLLAGTQPDADWGDAAPLWGNVFGLLMQPVVATALREGPFRQPLQQLVGVWLDTPATQQDGQRLRLAIVLGLERLGLELALPPLADAPARNPQEVAMSIETIARVGQLPHAARLLPLLKDDRICLQQFANQPQQRTVLVRDVALAWLLQLTGQKHAEYGMNRAEGWFNAIKQHPTNCFNYGHFFYEKETERETAFRKWADWLASNPLPKPPEFVPATPRESQAAALPQPVVPKRPPLAPPPTGPVLAERSQVNQLLKARRLMLERRDREAAVLLGEIAAMDEHVFYQPVTDVPLYRQLNTQAEQWLTELSVSGRQAYERQFGALARALLTAGVASGDTANLLEAERKYFCTQAGSEAAFLLATQHRTQGRFVQAALYLQRLRTRSPWADRFEPALSLELAICLDQSGMAEMARQQLRNLAAGLPEGRVEIAGRQQRLFAAEDDPLTWLRAITGPSPLSPQWPLFRRHAHGTPETDFDGPYLSGPALAAVVEDPFLAGLAAEIQTAFVEERRAGLPTLNPLVIGSTAVVRSLTALQAFDLQTGQRLWEAPTLNGLWYLLHLADEQQREQQRESLLNGLRQRLWDDPGFGTLSSNGRMVFALEDPAFAFDHRFRPPVVRPDGRRGIDTGVYSRSNGLAAYDLKTGKRCWQAAGPECPPGDPLQGARLLGPPLPLGDQLLVVAEFAEQSLLCALDAATGRLLDQWVLDAMWEEELSEEDEEPQFNLTVAAAPRGVSPVYADGLVICCTEKDRYVAVDLAARTVRWTFAAPLPSSPEQGVPPAQHRQQLRQQRGLHADQWCDAGAVLADGRVLITPWERDELVCLNLSDGQLIWSAPREDGMYLAGVSGERVLIVGRGKAHALSLRDGKPCWPRPVPLPGGAVPSGRGYLDAAQLYVPLTSAEVATIDLDRGCVVARSQSPDGVVPGNLAGGEGRVVSWGLDHLRSFDTLAVRLNQLSAVDPSPEQDLDAFLDRTELLLYSGQLQPAIERLRVAHVRNPTDRGGQLLGTALLQAAGTGEAVPADWVAEAERSIADPKRRAEFLERLIAVWEQSGRNEEALDLLFRLAESPFEDDLRALSSVHTVRRSRLLQSSLLALLDRLPAERRTTYEQRIAERLSSRSSAAQADLFAVHPLADPGRLEAARRYVAAENPLAAELALRPLLQHGDTRLRASATAQLADLLRAAGQTIEAARVYDHLNGPLADTVCLDDRTGGQLVAALAGDDPVRQWLAGRTPFPQAEPAVEVQPADPKAPQPPWGQNPLYVAADPGPFSPQVSADIDMQTKKLIGRDAAGTRRWEVELIPNPSNQPFWPNHYAMNEGHLVGNLLVVWLGARVVAIDTLAAGGQVRWTAESPANAQMHWWAVPHIQKRLQTQPGMRLPRGQFAQPLVATAETVVFQHGRFLNAVDPASGELLWLRDDLPAGCDLIGDNRVLLATPPDSREAVALSMLDGRELGRRPMPELERRLVVSGRFIVTWDEHDGGWELKRIDPWNSRPVWSQRFPDKTLVYPVERSEVAVLEPGGRLAIVDLEQGRLRWESRIKAPADPESILVLRSDRRYLLVVNRKPPETDVPPHVQQVAAGQATVDGLVYQFDADTGGECWNRDVSGQAIRLNYPMSAPALTFYRRWQTLERDANGNWRAQPPVIRTLAVDARSGTTLHESQIDKAAEMNYGLDFDAPENSLRLRTSRELITLRYGRPSGDAQ
jgi:outer membrane protein assembly factor BamB